MQETESLTYEHGHPDRFRSNEDDILGEEEHDGGESSGDSGGDDETLKDSATQKLVSLFLTLP